MYNKSHRQIETSFLKVLLICLFFSLIYFHIKIYPLGDGTQSVAVYSTPIQEIVKVFEIPWTWLCPLPPLLDTMIVHLLAHTTVFEISRWSDARKINLRLVKKTKNKPEVCRACVFFVREMVNIFVSVVENFVAVLVIFKIKINKYALSKNCSVHLLP